MYCCRSVPAGAVASPVDSLLFRDGLGGLLHQQQRVAGVQRQSAVGHHVFVAALYHDYKRTLRQ